ncbi:LacI family DNA-binding transcriptional regulator [Lactobacillus sp. M0396]|nr:LacI family DNA-binding transcriptional regulator [Lactobacillus sp. M0396]
MITIVTLLDVAKKANVSKMTSSWGYLS